jgi:hypothetical protein
VVERNFIHSLSITSTNLAAQLAGVLAAAGTATYSNNMVRLGVNAAGASITDGYVMYGMFDIAGTNNFYHNSVYIGGSGVTASSNKLLFRQQRHHQYAQLSGQHLLERAQQCFRGR